MVTKWYAHLLSPDASKGAIKRTRREAIRMVDEALADGRYTAGTVVRYENGYTDLVYEAKVVAFGKIKRSAYKTRQIA